MESKTKNRKTRDQIKPMVARAFDGMVLVNSADAVIELKDGWFNAVYEIKLADGRKVILKIAPPKSVEIMSYEKNIISTEVAVMRLVHENQEIPVPEIYFYDDTCNVCDSAYFFMEKINGDNLADVNASLVKGMKESIERQIGEIIREINGFPGPYFGYDGNPDLQAKTWNKAFIKIMESLLEDAARKEVVFDFSYDELRSVLLNHAPALNEISKPCLVHWDGWNPNFFIKDGKIVGLIDFERALWADPLMEAHFRPLFRGEGVNNSMQGYGKTSFTSAEEQRCHLYSLHLGLVMNIECYYRNYDTDEIFNLSRQLMKKTMCWLQEN